MAFFGSLLKTAIHGATLPVDLVKDAATMGGILTNENESYLVKKARKIERDVDDLENDLDRL